MSPPLFYGNKARKERKKTVEATLNFDNPQRIPRQLWLPYNQSRMKKISRWRKWRLKFPDDLVFCPNFIWPKKNKKLKWQDEFIYRDEWGCLFKKEADKRCDVLISPAIKQWENLENWRPPEQFLKLDKERINSFCHSTDRFVLAGSWIKLFERLQLLRGPEKLLSDLKKKPAEFFELLHQVHDFNLKELELWAQTEVDGLCLMDDWGGQESLFISRDHFRQLFKPLYLEYSSIAKKYKKYLFFHSDGYIADFLPDFIEIGINAINCQVLLMGIEKLVHFRGQITFWGSSDFPVFLSTAQKKEIVRCCQQIFDTLWARGGLIAQVELTPDIKISAIKTFFSAWKKFL